MNEVEDPALKELLGEWGEQGERARRRQSGEKEPNKDKLDPWFYARVLDDRRIEFSETAPPSKDAKRWLKLPRGDLTRLPRGPITIEQFEEWFIQYALRLEEAELLDAIIESRVRHDVDSGENQGTRPSPGTASAPITKSEQGDKDGENSGALTTAFGGLVVGIIGWLTYRNTRSGQP